MATIVTLLFTLVFASGIQQGDVQQAQPLTVETSSDGHYKINIQGQPWMRSAATFLQASHHLWSTTTGDLKLAAAPSEDTGSDSLGRWKAVNLTYGFKDKTKVSYMDAVVRSYIDKPVVMFSQVFHNSLKGCSVDNSDRVVSSFPSFHIDDFSSLGLLSFGGLFVGREKMHIQRFQRGLVIADGLESGPLVVFDNSSQVLIISPFNQFMSASLWHDKDGHTLHWGVMGKVYSIPKGFHYDTVIYYSNEGINKAMEGWGQTLRNWYGKGTGLRDQDPTINSLGYYTDNGAYYYHNTEAGLNYEETILAVNGYAHSVGIPYKYLQYDDWWYYVQGPGYGATLKWEAMPSIFPHGLQNLFNKTGLPVVAHNRFWSNKTSYATHNGGPFAFIVYKKLALPVQQEFWEWLFQRAMEWGMIVYEQDFLSYQTEHIYQLHSDVGLGDQWLTQMGNAASRYGLTLQYCMALPRHVLQSVKIPAVTQVRVSIDYHLQSDQWRIGVSSMLAHAVGLAPFKDNFWSTSVQPGNPYNKTEKSPLLEALVSVLSAGPVAVGDKIGLSDPGLLARTHRVDGLLLKPGKPATAIDAQILQAAFGGNIGPSGEVWTTQSIISGQLYGIIFAADLSNPYSIGPSAAGFESKAAFGGNIGPSGEVWTTQSIISGQLYGIIFAADLSNPYSIGPSAAGFESKWPRTAVMGHQMVGPPTREPQIFSDDHPLVLSKCPLTEPCLYYTSPVFLYRGVVVVIGGELSRFVPMSSQRVFSVSSSTADVTVTLKGSRGEKVDFYIFVSTKWHHFLCVMSPVGQATISLAKNICQ